MPRRMGAAFTAIAAVLFAGSHLRAQTDPSPGRVYRLEPSSTYQRGCFPPCLCPMMESGTLRGTFRLAHPVTGDSFQSYLVKDVEWIVELPSSAFVHRVVGSGTYKFSLATSGRMHQMILDLAIDQNVTQHFDSGLVPMTSQVPRIDISISINGGVCQDTVLALHARPLVWMNVGPSTVSWVGLPDSSGYDVVRGDLDALHGSGGDFATSTRECLADGASALSLAYSAAPAPGHGYYFLARDAVGASPQTWDEGDLGQVRSRDPSLQNAAGSCP